MSYIEYSILGLLIITLILVIYLFIKLYLKIKSSDKNNINVIEFPKETKDNINNFINHINKHNQELKDFLTKKFGKPQRIKDNPTGTNKQAWKKLILTSYNKDDNF